MGKFPFEEINREILIKRKSEDKPDYQRHIKELLDYGVINIDKPKGPTSHQVADFVQKILKISKSGHSGTLDPQVTGSLVVAVSKATRIVQALLTAGKEYVCLMHIHKEIDEKKIKKTLKDFTGKITQLPPVKSAILRVERERNIYYIDLLEIDGQDVLFRIGCQAGTYIRKICHDMGRALGTGAHMAELRRTRVGPFDESTLVTLNDLADAFWYYENGNDKFISKLIQPVENAVKHLPMIWVLGNTVSTLSHGADLKVPGIAKLHSNIQKDDIVAVMGLDKRLLALGDAKMTSEEMMEKDKGLAVTINKVFINQ
ncbi:MAG: RNA-guided pseudouridylation complex pseudouridine synthase subunit Cbf5 [Nanoarchaeota archaeon]|nr:RNA-guided pseudouridylation complex pseudouridine synthase subunit Cbf5 [Nanoarchaeota archaeon]MBU1704487.1 RNA-guided pseudouridylation complex pseudouridine synthase subunit Cbf5 [Nanoarchaeota archaeon]